LDYIKGGLNDYEIHPWTGITVATVISGISILLN